MVFNADKCYFLAVGFNEPYPDFSFNDTTVKNFTGEKIIRKVIDNQLNFKSHLKDIFRKTNQKLSAHSRK